MRSTAQPLCHQILLETRRLPLLPPLNFDDFIYLFVEIPWPDQALANVRPGQARSDPSYFLKQKSHKLWDKYKYHAIITLFITPLALLLPH